MDSVRTVTKPTERELNKIEESEAALKMGWKYGTNKNGRAKEKLQKCYYHRASSIYCYSFFDTFLFAACFFLSILFFSVFRNPNKQHSILLFCTKSHFVSLVCREIFPLVVCNSFSYIRRSIYFDLLVACMPSNFERLLVKILIPDSYILLNMSF